MTKVKIKDKRIDTIIKLSKQAFGPYKLQIIVLTILSFVSGLLEGIGINAIVPLISTVTKEGVGEADIITRTLASIFKYFHIDFSLKFILVFIALLFILKAIALIICNYIKIKISATYEEQTRNKLFSKTMNASWPYLSNQKLGHLATILKINIMQSAKLLETIGTTIMTLTGLIIYAVIAVNISLNITLFTLAFGGLFFLFIKPLLYKTRTMAQKVASTNKQIAHYVNEKILGIKTIKSLLVENKIVGTGKEYFRKLKNLKIRIALLRNIPITLTQPISLVFVCVIFAFAYKTPGFSFAIFVPVMYLIYRIFQYIQKMQGSLHQANETIPYLKDVLRFEKEANENKEEISGSRSFKFNNDLEFKNVSFSYNSNKAVLSNLNFEIKKGQMAGLIGPSGVGKTTIVDLILRLLSPTKGKISVDNKDISKININLWRRNIGYVPQDIFLINDTVLNNIKFYDSKITNKQVARAARQANIYNFIQTLPNKFNTVIGERGIFLSAGQRQRIVIARVLARNPKFLILDEATSSLDNESEIKVQKAIENLREKITIFVIAHRLSTVKNCDKLLVLERGKIIEKGDPIQLLKDKKSYFYKVYNIRE